MKKLFSQTQAGHVWKDCLGKGLNESGFFVQSKVNACVFYKGKIVLLLHVDNVILHDGSSSRQIWTTSSLPSRMGLMLLMKERLMITWDSRSSNLVIYRANFGILP
jgi:hypothetical protein